MSTVNNMFVYKYLTTSYGLLHLGNSYTDNSIKNCHYI